MKFRSLSCCATLITAVATTSCSDPEPATPRGGITANITGKSPPEPGRACQIQKLARIGDPEISETNSTGMISHGDDGADISCTVRKTSDGHQVAIEASQDVSATIGGVRVNFRTNFTLNSENVGNGSLFVQTDLASISSQEQPCTFRATSGGLQVAPGNVWAAFDCTAYDRSSPNSTFCAVRGVVAFENCRK